MVERRCLWLVSFGREAGLAGFLDLRNRDGGPASRHTLEGVMDLPLGMGVQVFRGLVQQQVTGIIENLSGDGKL